MCNVLLSEGYGKQTFENFHKLKPTLLGELKKPYLPLTLGRDFSGIVQAVGAAVKDLKPGDQVMGVIPAPLPGSHSQYIVASSCNVKVKPEHLSIEEAASIPYAGLTAWSALSITAELCMGSKDKKVLVLGGAGGVGTIAVQLLRCWGTMVMQLLSILVISELEMKLIN